MRRLFFIFLITILAEFCAAQSQNLYRLEVDGHDTLVSVILPKIDVKAKPRSSRYYNRQQQAMTRLEHNVRRAYPYARIVAIKVDEINKKLEKIEKNKDKDKWLDEEYKKLFKEFKAPLMKLTYTQGRILVRLIYRETDKSAYSQIKEFKGGLSAFFWQSIALMFGNNLKNAYDPLGEDAQIEAIVQKIESGH